MSRSRIDHASKLGQRSEGTCHALSPHRVSLAGGVVFTVFEGAHEVQFGRGVSVLIEAVRIKGEADAFGLMVGDQVLCPITRKTLEHMRSILNKGCSGLTVSVVGFEPGKVDARPLVVMNLTPADVAAIEAFSVERHRMSRKESSTYRFWRSQDV